MVKILCALLLVLTTLPSLSQISFDNKLMVMENELVKQTISFTGGKITPVSVFSKSLNIELLSPVDSQSWFEFVIDNSLVTSDQPIWKVLGYELRDLNNGGKEIKILVEATKQVKGLQIEIYRQLFPHSTLIREKLVLKANGVKTFKMNKLNEKLHFIFPRYSLVGHSEVNSIKETRIATFDKEIIDNFNPGLTWDDRRAGYNLAQCHMFHPDILIKKLSPGEKYSVKGPFVTYETDSFSWMMTYEHASQDKNYGSEFGNVFLRRAAEEGTDQLQGVTGASGIVESPNDFWFLSLSGEKKPGSTSMFVEIRRGGYLEGEVVSLKNPYETVWSTSAFFFNNSDEEEIVHNYLWKYISENRASRKSHFYYNTWGMQRDNTNTTGLREIFTEVRIIDEIRNAADLNVDLFVLDDGWEETFGVWRPNKKRLPDGLAPVVSEIKKHNMIPGIWLSPMGIDSLAERYKDHPEWVLRDKDGVPIKAQWGFPAFDFVSGFYELFLDDCKKLIDEGIRFFKWDAINTFNSTLPDLDHGSSKYSREEISDRYGYMLPFYVTRAMKELREYNDEVVIEIDLTEKERCIIGLMPLQEGKLFWMNNGASSYNDYSKVRTMSMRNVINEYAGIIPNELFTQAVYPHQVRPYDAQRYNVNTTLAGGRGFWGNLNLMSEQQRKKAGWLVGKSKKVLPYLEDMPLKVTGEIGASPEIYCHVNFEAGAGQIIAFSGSAMKYNYSVAMNTDSTLAVLNHAYDIKNSTVEFPFEFSVPDDTREAFILPNKGDGISIISSSGWLDNVEVDKASGKMNITTGSASVIRLRFSQVYRNIRSGNDELVRMAGSGKDGYNYYELNSDAEEVITIEWH